MMPLEKLYELRKNFSVIGLTGRKGSGCSSVAESFAAGSISDLNIRTPHLFNIKGRRTNFSRKYKICYEFAKKHWKQYQIIKFRDVILFEVLRTNDRKNKKLLNEINSHYKLIDDQNKIEKSITSLLVDYEPLINRIKKLGQINTKLLSISKLEELYTLYFGKAGLIEFANSFYGVLDQIDMCARALFVHRISNNLRGSGKAWSAVKVYSNCKATDHIYHIAEIINRIIKAWKTRNPDVHIVIDALRNSLELMFFKERYSAFYMVSVSSDFRKENLKASLIKKKVKLSKIDKIVNEIIKLDETEYKCNDFKKGLFWAPDVQNCIQKADIHLRNNKYEIIEGIAKQIVKNSAWSKDVLYTVDEQILKFATLIIQPGLVTPSAQERCMQIAYNAKSNSGCISRQVGAVVSDENFSVKSIGWNDVPKGTTPCNLRNIYDFIGNKDTSAFSTFEKAKFTDDIKSKGFQDFVKRTYNTSIKSVSPNNCFCFKTLYNCYEGKDNQVHTRSLHAEENAMMQISKNGGQGLEGGILFTTASPCELCAKKSYQLGIKEIYYIDPYPGISANQIIRVGDNSPDMILFDGCVGSSFHKLYEPFMPLKDENQIRTGIKPKVEIKTKFTVLVDGIIDEKNTNRKELKKLKEYCLDEPDKIQEILLSGFKSIKNDSK